jgi:hypothetical protein
VSSVELTDGRGGEGAGGAKLFDGVKDWSTINHSILSGEGNRRTSKNTKLSLSEPVRLSASESFERRKSGLVRSF